MLTFNLKYFLLALLLFIIEVLIAIFVHDDFVRPYLGDVLVVILIYAFLKSFIGIQSYIAIIAVLLFAFAIECLQYVNFIEHAGLEKSGLARTVLGSLFSWLDIAAYCVGGVVILLLERLHTVKSRV